MTSSKCLTDLVTAICTVSIGLASRAVDTLVIEIGSCTQPVVSCTSSGCVAEDASPPTASGFTVITGISTQAQARE
jgi:hypothetical protein